MEQDIISGWESVMLQLNHALENDSENDTGTGQCCRRVKYVIDGETLVNIICQRQTGTGEWSDERGVSVKSFLFDDLPFLDEADRAVISAMMDAYYSKAGYSRKTVIPRILPYLAGTERVFDIAGNQIGITENAKPSINIFHDNGAIVIGSDMNPDSIGRLPRNVVRRINDMHYEIVTADTGQRKILNMLLRTRTFPISAAADLKIFLDKVRDRFNVFEDLDSLINMPRLDTDGKIAVKVSVYSGQTYSIKIEARPCTGCDMHFIPGTGVEEFIHEGVVYCRNLAKEKQNADIISGKLRSIGRGHNNGTYFVSSVPKLLDILCFTHSCPDAYILEWGGGKKISVGKMSFSSGNALKLTTEENWFEVEGQLQVDDKSLSFKEILKHSKDRIGRDYIQIDDQTYIRLTRKLQKQLECMSLIAGPSGRIPKYYVGQLARILGKDSGGDAGGLAVSPDQGFDDLLGRMLEAYSSIPETPVELNAELRPYQREGFEWIARLDAWGAGACLADDMGLGKTVQTIAFLLYKAQEGPSLVVAPKSVVPNWKSEIARFAPTLNCKVLNSVKDREGCVSLASDGDVIVATYGLLVSDEKIITGKKWNVVCLDEAHYIKNRDTKVSKSAMELDAGSRITLTGTPVQNNLSELWNLLQFINPGILGSYSDFVDRYKNSPDTLHLQEEHRKLIQPFILRRTKEEVLYDLPVKTEFDYLVPLSEAEMAGYEQLREQILEQVMDDENRISAFSGITGLKLAACSMALRDPDWEYKSSKVVHLMKILSGLYCDGNNVLIFSQFTSFLNEVRLELEEHGMKYFYMDGQTPIGERQRLTSEFQEGRIPIFLISLKAGGLGLNLTAANYVILLDIWWNPAIENQAMDRAHRIGQSRDVTVIRLISQNTIEEKIVRLQDMKQMLSDNIMDGTSDTARLSYEEILELLQK